MKSTVVCTVSALLAAAAPAVHSYAYEAESFTSAKCGLSMAIPAGTRARVSETMGADGLCRIDLEVEGVEFHGVTRKDPSVTLQEAQNWTVTDSGIASGQWTQFDEGETHIGYKATVGGKNVWGAAARGSTHSCAAFVRADAGESEANLEQFYQSLDCP